jgi:hypothetical protein
MTSSNWIEISSFQSGTTAPDSGRTLTICGGKVSIGPPGGVPTLAHALMHATTMSSRAI